MAAMRLLSPNSGTADTTPDTTAQIPNVQWFQVVDGSIYDGDTLRVTSGDEEIKIRFCGIDAPEKAQDFGEASRDRLRELVSIGGNQLGIVPIEQDRYGRTVAEVWITTVNDGAINLNTQLVADGMAYHYEQYSGNCPSKSAIASAETEAIARGAGVWSRESIRPWDYRRTTRQ